MVVPCFLWQRLRCSSLPMQMKNYLQMKGGRLNHSPQLHTSAVDYQQQIPAATPWTHKYICLNASLNPSAPCWNHTMPDTSPEIYREWLPCKQQYCPSWFPRHVEVPSMHALVQIFFHTTHIPTHPYHHSQFLVWCKNNQISSWGAVTACPLLCPLLSPLLLHYLLSLLHPFLLLQRRVWRLMVVWMMV